eukprot:scaffold34650_cov50-Attheya_sp.AAC.2
MDPSLCQYHNGLERCRVVMEAMQAHQEEEEVSHSRSGRALLSSHLPDWQRGRACHQHFMQQGGEEKQWQRRIWKSASR